MFKFRGHIAPVFTPFHSDRTLNLNIIPDYAHYLLEKGINGVLVNGTSGEGMSLNVQERKFVTEVWVKICKITKQTLMIQVGGAPLPDVIELAKHAESLKVDSILCLPELYFKPKTVDQLINYLKIVSDAAPNTPLLYYHIPAFSDVKINMAEFLRKVNGEISNLAGIKFTSADLIEATECIKVCDGKFAVFLGADQILSAAYLLGFDSAIATTFNIFPEFGGQILSAIKKDKPDMMFAQQTQNKLTDCVNTITKHGDWVTTMKSAMNLFTPINVGPVRLPLQELRTKQKNQMRDEVSEVLNDK